MAVNNKVAQIFIASAGEVIKNVDNTVTVMVHAQIWPPFNSGVFRSQQYQSNRDKIHQINIMILKRWSQNLHLVQIFGEQNKL